VRACLALTVLECGLGASACNLVFGLDPPTGGGAIDASAAPDAAEGADASPTKFGSISTVSAEYVQNGVDYHARSVAITIGDSATTCTPVASTTECASWTCVRGAEPMMRDHAGAVIVRGDISSVTLQPDAAGFYTPVSDAVAVLYTDGATASISASGGDVPAFELSVPAPLRARFEQTWLPAPGETTLITRNTFNLTWLPVDAESVVVSIGQSTPAGTPFWTSRCVYPADRGSGSYDGAILAGAPIGTLGLATVVYNRGATVVGDYTMSATISVIGIRPDGARVLGSVTVN
jgi:hypothetical protein